MSDDVIKSEFKYMLSFSVEGNVGNQLLVLDHLITYEDIIKFQEDAVKSLVITEMIPEQMLKMVTQLFPGPDGRMYGKRDRHPEQVVVLNVITFPMIEPEQLDMIDYTDLLSDMELLDFKKKVEALGDKDRLERINRAIHNRAAYKAKRFNCEATLMY